MRRLPAPVRDALLIEAEKRNDPQRKAVADHFAKTEPEMKRLTKSLDDHAARAPTAEPGADDGPWHGQAHARADSRRLLAARRISRSGTPAVLPAMHASEPSRGSTSPGGSSIRPIL